MSDKTLRQHNGGLLQTARLVSQCIVSSVKILCFWIYSTCIDSIHDATSLSATDHYC